MVNDEIEDGESRVDIEIGTISEAAAEEKRAYTGSVSLENETAFDGSQCAEVPNGQQENLAQQPIVDEHCHSSIKVDKGRNRRPLIKLTIALCLCVAFMIGEIVGGVLANSISIQTDAAHMATDIVGFIFSIIAILISKKKPSRRMTFGYFRSEVMGAFLSILIIWVLTTVLVYLAVMRVVTMSFEIEPVPMVATASCGVAFNLIMFIVLDTNLCFRDKKEPQNDEEQVENGQTEVTQPNEEISAESVSIGRRSKAITRIRSIFKRSDKSKKAKKEKDENINLRAAAIHVIGDLIQSVGVLVAAIIIYINPEYKLADPICTFTFSALVLSTTSFIVKDIFLVLMESAPSPKQLKYTDVVSALTRMIGVKDIHNLNIWCLTMDKIALNVHLVIDRDGDTQKVLKEASDILRSQFKIELSNIQVEYFSDGMTSCEYCKLPEK